jgi:hypothetical protein
LEAAEGGGNGLWQFWSAWTADLEKRKFDTWLTVHVEGVLGEVRRVNIERHDLFFPRQWQSASGRDKVRYGSIVLFFKASSRKSLSVETGAIPEGLMAKRMGS